MELGVVTGVFGKIRADERLSLKEQLRDCAKAGFKKADLDMSLAAAAPNELAEENWKESVFELADEAAKLGVSFSQATAPYDANLFVAGERPDEYRAFFGKMNLRAVKAAGILGIPWIVEHPLTDTINTEYDNDIQRNTNISFYSETIEEAKKAGAGVAFENQAETSRVKIKRKYGADVDDLIDLADAFGDEKVGICWNFGHGRIMYGNQSRQLRRLKGRVKAVHASDNTGNGDYRLLPFAGGDIPWESVMPALREAGYEGDFILECHGFAEHMPDGMRDAAAKLMREFGMRCISLFNGE